MTTAYLAIAIFFAAFILMALRSKWLALIAFSGAFAMALCGVIEPNTVLSQFGTSSFFCVVGMMVVGGCLSETGVIDRVSELLFSRKLQSDALIFAFIFTAVAMFSAFLSNTTCTAVFLPLLAGLKRKDGSRALGAKYFMSIGIAATLGGCATLIGSPSQHTMAQQLLTGNGFEPMGFFYGVPGTLGMLAVMLLYFHFFGRRQFEKLENREIAEAEPKKKATESRIVWKELVSVLILVGSILLIATKALSSGAGAMLGALLCVLTGCINLDTALKLINWPVAITLGGLLGMAEGFNQSGAPDMIVQGITGLLGPNVRPFAVFAILMLAAILITNILDNIATQAMLGQICLSLAIYYGINPRLMVYGLLFACNTAFATPLGTPAMTMTMAGNYKFSDYAKIGGPLCLLGFLYILVVLPLIYGF
jgi:anion transporter